MLISDVLRAKGADVVTVAPTATVRELVDLLGEHGVGAVVVSSDGAAVAGIVSERDVVRRLRTGADLLDAPVSEIMTAQVRTCEPGQTVDSLMPVMTDHRIRHLPVVEHGSLCGIVSIGDVVKARIGDLQHERDQLASYVGS